MRAPVAIVVAFAAGLIGAAVLGPPHDGDLWWQTWLGATILRTHAIPRALGAETFSAVGAPWTAHEWLFSVLLAAASAHGLRVVFALAVGACALAAVVLTGVRAERAGASPLAAAVATALAVVAMTPSLGLRVQVLAWLFVAAFVPLALDAKRRWWCIPVAVAWANIHASVLLAPATTAVVVAAELIARHRARNGAPPGGEARSADRRDVLVLVGTLLAPLLTPLGWGLPAYAIALAQSPIRHYIVEWQSPFHSPFYAVEIGLATLAAAAAFLPRRAQAGPRAERASGSPLAERGVTLLYYVLALLATRHVPVFFLVVAPIAASRFPAGREARAGVTGLPAVLLDGALLIAACAAGIVAALASARAHPPLPYAAIASVTSGARDVRLFCSDFSWCGMAVGRPGVRVFLDGRADPYPELMFAETLAFTNGLHGLDALDRTAIDTVLVATTAQLARSLAHARGWTRTFDDGRYAVFRRVALSTS